MLVDRREALTRRRIQTVDRLQALLAELLPGQAKKDISTGQAKRMLATVRPRDRLAMSPATPGPLPPVPAEAGVGHRPRAARSATALRPR